jgi:hypothetical protein
MKYKETYGTIAPKSQAVRVHHYAQIRLPLAAVEEPHWQDRQNCGQHMSATVLLTCL